jgi:uncharacterized membrane protein YkoI
MNSRSIASGFAAIGTLCLTMIGTGAAQTPQSPEAVTPEQAIECIRTATAATPGRVEGLEVEREKGQLLCEVEVVAENGTRSEIHIDVATSRIVRGSR